MKTVIIQKQLLHELEVAIKSHNQNSKPKLKIDVSVYFISLFNSIPSFYREDKRNTYYVNLNSKLLKKASSKYLNYLNFFLRNGYIEKVANYSTDRGESNSFRLNESYLKDEITIYHLSDKVLLKALSKVDDFQKVREKNLLCEEKRLHLTKYFNDNLKINSEEAFIELKLLLPEKYRKFTNGCQIVNEFMDEYWRYSMKPKTDNRIHSNFTRSPKIIRKHITYKGEHIEGVDVKTSQPFFLSIILKAILEKDTLLLKNIEATKILSSEVIEGLFNLELDKNELLGFISFVTEKDFYNEFSKSLTFNYDEEGNVFRMVSNFKAKHKKRKRRNRIKESHSKVIYKSERDATKEIVMELFYSSPNSKVTEARIFRKEFPNIHKIFKYIHSQNIKLHHLLQYVEAYILLDYVAKIFSEQYPDLALWSIHDCLVTASSNTNLLKHQMKYLINQITTLTPQLDIERWGEEEEVIFNKAS